jgi:HSP20 family protein
MPCQEDAMWTHLGDFDRTFALLDELLRRRVERPSSDEASWAPDAFATDVWPRVNVRDAGASVVLEADVPGLSDKDLQVEVTGETLTLRGERKVEVPEGYSVHRRERGGFKFSRSFTLPHRIAADQTTASVKDGVLTLTLAKAPEAQPRQIAVRSQ